MSENKSEFRAVHVFSLRGSVKISFEVYIGVGSKYILYAKPGDSFDGIRLKRLEEKKVGKLFIKKEDFEKYKAYLAQSLDRAYSAQGGDLKDRAAVIQGLRQKEAEELMQNPDSEETFRDVQESTKRFIEFLAKESHGLSALLQMQQAHPSLAEHAANVASISTALAMRSHGKDNPLVQSVSIGCLLHDIDHFYSQLDLARPISAIPEDEIDEYRNHPRKGAERLQGLLHFDQLILQVISQHEEQIDGQGYPAGLSGKNVEPLILVAATANAYDRLVTFERMPPKGALKQLFINKMGAYPLEHLQALQSLIKDQNLF